MAPAPKFDSALELHRAGRLTEAEALYLEVTSGDPRHANAWYLLGVLSMTRGDDPGALERFERAVEVMPDNPAFLSNLGVVLRRLGRLDEAGKALLRAVTIKPDLVEASHNLGLVLMDQGDRVTALQCFERVADLKPDLFANQLQLARALAAGPDLRRAVGHYHCALAIDPNSREVMQELAAVLRKLGRKPGASALLAKAGATGTR